MTSDLLLQARDQGPRPAAELPSRALRTGPRAGHGCLAVAIVDGATAVVACAAEPPLHLFTPCARGPAVSALIASYGGGLVAGDLVDVALEVGPGAVASVGTQAETKVYRSAGRWAEQRVTARVGADAALAIVPEPTSCFAGARFRQHQRFELDARGSLLLVDAVTPGRSARGERWAFEAYLSRNDVHVGGRPVLSDAVRLVQGEGPSVARRMGPWEMLATVVLIGPALRCAASAALEHARGLPADGGAAVLATASPLLDGAYLRIAARSVEAGLAFVRARVAPAAATFGRATLERRP